MDAETFETITEAELAKALDGLYIAKPDGSGHGVFIRNPGAFAANLFERARRHREPEYEAGEMYRDADGINWLYAPERDENRDGSWADCPWLKPGDRGAFSLNSPIRPLCKLVPEDGKEETGNG